MTLATSQHSHFSPKVFPFFQLCSGVTLISAAIGMFMLAGLTFIGIFRLQYLLEAMPAHAGVETVIDAFDEAAWEEIARIGPAGRSAEECLKQWTHQLRPSLNKADWTAEEDALLLAQVNRLGTHAVRLF